MKRIIPSLFFLLHLAILPTSAFAADTVSHGKQVSIHYTLTLDDGTVVSTTRDGTPLTYIQGTHNIVPGLEKALEGLSVGKSLTVRVPPADGYGEFQSGKIVEVKKSEINGELKVGALLEGARPTGEVLRSRVVEIKDDTVVLDFNHPMAGKHLNYEVAVVGVQDSPASNTGQGIPAKPH